MGGGNKVKSPKMSQQEKDLIAAQTDILKQQQALIEQQTATQNLLAPYLYESAGLKPTMDASGKITGFSKIANPMQDQLQSIQQGFLDRTQAALAGNLPVDPALIRQLNESGQTLNESLHRQLGTGYATSTPGIQALADFEQRKTEALDAARRGDLTMATQLGLNTGQFNSQQLSQFLSNTAGVSNLSNQNAQLLGQAVQGYGAVAQPYQIYSQLGYNANLANQQNQAQQMTGFGTLAGSLGSAYLLSGALGGGSGFTGAGLAAMFSDRRLKTDVRRLGQLSNGLPVYSYNYPDGEAAIGVMADEVLEVVPQAVGERDGFLTVDYEVLAHGL